MKSRFCAECHPTIYAEHAQNTHGRAFTDAEVRLATGRFSHGDCIICHTPRPIFETGMGMNPMRRHHGLVEGNTCMTCHWRPDYDYGSFRGGAECREAFDPRVGRVEACASCHRNHGTPYQWELAPTGKARGRRCVDCHMPKVRRPVARGEEPRLVRSHMFPGSRSESQLRKAYSYEAEIAGDRVVVRIRNKGAGHNFPTELKQRALESLIVVRDGNGREVARSRMVFRDPYKRPYGLKLPVNTQIPAGETAVHSVPLKVSSGTAECELHFKLYYPIDDYHPDLARLLEKRVLPFEGIEPSPDPVISAPEVAVRVPEQIAPEDASPPNLVDFAKPPIGKVEVEVPEGDSRAEIAELIRLFQFPVPAANKRARDRLVAIGRPAVPQLIEAMGSWDNKTWNQAMDVLERIGRSVVPEVTAALDREELYVRVHARRLLARLGVKESAVLQRLIRDLSARHALDRASAAEVLGDLRAEEAAPALRRALDDTDPDVVRAAALALGRIGDRGAVAAIRAAMRRFSWPETRRDLALALAGLGDPRGAEVLLAGLDLEDDLIRESYFESFFAVTSRHESYDPLAPRSERLEAVARLRRWWARAGGASVLHPAPTVPRGLHNEVWKILKALGGGDGLTPGGDDERLVRRLVQLGEPAVPVIVEGLKYPPGFATKRALICRALGEIGSRLAAPALVATLRDPVVGVASWACWALGRLRDSQALPALERYHASVRWKAARGAIPASAGHPDLLLAQAAAARLLCGDRHATADLVALLLSEEAAARRIAIQTLAAEFGETRGYRHDAPAAERCRAAARWAR